MFNLKLGYNIFEIDHFNYVFWNPHLKKWSGTNFQVISSSRTQFIARRLMPVDRKIARRWKRKLEKGLGPSVHISRTAGDIELKFGTHVFLININLHTKNQQILRGWVTWPISFDMEWPSPFMYRLMKNHNTILGRTLSLINLVNNCSQLQLSNAFSASKLHT